MGIDIISFGYAAIVATGGIIGYVKAGSVPSLAAGLTFGGLAALGAYQTTRNPNNFYLILGTTFALTGFMGYRFVNSGKFMPAGLVALLSALMVARFATRAVLLTKNE